METESQAARRRPPFSVALFHLHEPLRRTVAGLRNLRSPYQRYRHARGLHGLRVAVAMLVTLLITNALDLPHSIWAAVSMMVVIGGLQHHGNIRKKAAERALGTILGAVAGLFLILLDYQFQSAAVTMAATAVIAGICAYHAIGRGGYIALLTAITMIIVGGQGGDTLETGLWRTLNVCIGIAIAVAFSFALPLNASYSWRYDLALNLRRVAGMVRRLQSEAVLTTEARNKIFADLSRRSIALRGLMPSVAKEMNASPGLLEEIQHHHRSIIASMELLSSARLNVTDADLHAMSQSFRGPAGYAMRAPLLAMARALRAGNTAVLDTAAMAAGKRAAMSAPASAALAADAVSSYLAADEAAGVMPLPSVLQGPDWVMRQTVRQIDQLRATLVMLKRMPG
jgi:uncharacterized membrane protein YccC